MHFCHCSVMRPHIHISFPQIKQLSTFVPEYGTFQDVGASGLASNTVVTWANDEDFAWDSMLVSN